MMNSVAIARDEKELYYLPVSMISPNPYQPRRQFDPMQLVELAQSIKQHGVMQPINVRMMDGGYELVSGERRLRATILADIDTIPAIIIDIT
ncbi:MAG: ParB/RepB/Spo0J family partition protein, partial [Defluviitaleaceae bacterium]|nr:ParB/RepB/Spo0J family partition protein [Defluviitaleaceae bacterium]